MARKTARPPSSGVAARYTAGAIATAAASASGVAIAYSGVVASFDPIDWLAAPFGGVYVIGLAVHLVVGIGVLPELYRRVRGRGPLGSGLAGGLVFGLCIAWAALLLVLPAIGGSAFGLILGWPVPFALILVHAIYGAVLGLFQN